MTFNGKARKEAIRIEVVDKVGAEAFMVRLEDGSRIRLSKNSLPVNARRVGFNGTVTIWPGALR